MISTRSRVNGRSSACASCESRTPIVSSWLPRFRDGFGASGVAQIELRRRDRHLARGPDRGTVEILDTNRLIAEEIRNADRVRVVCVLRSFLLVRCGPCVWLRVGMRGARSRSRTCTPRARTSSGPRDDRITGWGVTLRRYPSSPRARVPQCTRARRRCIHLVEPRLRWRSQYLRRCIAICLSARAVGGTMRHALDPRRRLRVRVVARVRG